MKKNHFLSAAFLSLLAASCHKSDTPGNTYTPPVYGTYSSLSAIYQLLSPAQTITNINGNTGGTFFGVSGTRYIFSAGCFQDAAGATVTGNVTITAMECLNKGDMIFSGMLPVSDNNPLISGGEISVTASCNGQKVFLKPGYAFQANIPRNGDTLTGYQFYAGDPASNQSNNANIVNWHNRTDSIHGSTLVMGTDTISLFSDSIRNCNADQLGLPTWNPQNFNLAISIAGMSTPPADSCISAYSSFDHYKTVWPFGYTGSYSNGVYNEWHVPAIPVHFIAFAVVNNKFYGGIVADTPVTGKTYTLTLTETNPAAFKQLINNNQ